MGLLDMFDKLDDIIYKPVEVVGEWLKEPLRKMEHKRQKEAAQQKTDLEMQKLQNEKALELWDEEKRQLLRITAQKADLELQNMAEDSRLARNETIVKAIQNYQIDLARVNQEIIESIGRMNIAMRAEANDMVLKKTRDYKALQEETIKKSDERLEEIQIKYANNERIRLRMEDAVLAQMDSIINYANQFINELSVDLRKINDMIGTLTESAIENTQKVIQSLPTGAKYIMIEHENHTG